MTSHWPATRDPLEFATLAERVNYATGLMLDAQDFRDEQTYHRGRLARLIQALVGHGTLAGLAVMAPDDSDSDRELRVLPGIAADRRGRLIELAGPQCIGLARWYAQQDDTPLLAAMSIDPDDGDKRIVTFDVFLSAHECARGHSPAFASGTQDSIDATVPSRLEERGSLTLVLRPEGGGDPIPAPKNNWPAANGSAASKLAAVLGAWPDQAQDELPALPEHVAGQDCSAVLLARITLPVEAPGSGAIRPRLKLDAAVRVDNSLRPFVFMPGKWFGETLRTVQPVQP